MGAIVAVLKSPFASARYFETTLFEYPHFYNSYTTCKSFGSATLIAKLKNATGPKKILVKIVC